MPKNHPKVPEVVEVRTNTVANPIESDIYVQSDIEMIRYWNEAQYRISAI
jgi:hypothetical protein